MLLIGMLPNGNIANILKTISYIRKIQKIRLNKLRYLDLKSHYSWNYYTQ
jgi:hypothetical protein